MDFNVIVGKLSTSGKTISTMESCTGGFLASEITNIDGSSEVIKFSAVTYSNEFKVKMGVDANVIEKFSVYSEETAKEMSKNISVFADSNYGVGITGKINRNDKNNPGGEDNVIYVSIYDRDNDVYYTDKLFATEGSRRENKVMIVNHVGKMLESML
jgi:nicotinamide-nucleotide amidase